MIPETSSVFSGSLVPPRKSTSSDLVTVDVRKVIDSLVHHLQPINSIPTTPKNSSLAHVQSTSDENIEVDLQDDRKHRREDVLAMALDSMGKVIVATDDPLVRIKIHLQLLIWRSLQSRLFNSHELP